MEDLNEREDREGPELTQLTLSFIWCICHTLIEYLFITHKLFCVCVAMAAY